MKTLFALLLCGAASLAASGATFSANPVADAFVTTGPSNNLLNNNYGGGGSITVAAPGQPEGEAQSVLRFDLSGAATSFDSVFGAGQWSIESVTLQLRAANANNAIFNSPLPGLIGISWMQNDAWTEGTGSPSSPGATGITFNSLQSTYIGASDQSLGAFSFPGVTSGAFNYSLTLSSGLSADVLGGQNLSLRLFGADTTVAGVFNSKDFGTAANRPVLTIVAVPEPGTVAFGGLAVLLLAGWRLTTRINRS